MKSRILRFFVVFTVSVIIEMVVFQGVTIVNLLDNNIVKNRVYTLLDFEYINWSVNEDDMLVSENDPILVLADVNTYIDSIKIITQMSDQLQYLEVFYVNAQYPNYGDIVKHCDEVNNNAVNISIGDDVRDLRIDLGDEAGVILTNIIVTINPVSFHFSFSRVITLLIIYYGAYYLFALQKMPNYNLEDLTKKG